MGCVVYFEVYSLCGTVVQQVTVEISMEVMTQFY